MDLNNKTVAFLGDSITEGLGASAPSNHYVNVFSKIANAKVLNYGISGTRFAPQKSPSVCEMWDKDFISRVPEMEKDVNAVVVFGGTNDFGHGDAPFGDISDTEATTFCGACDYLMKLLIEKYPTKPIIFMTPLHRCADEYPVNEIGIERKPLSDYASVIKKKAEKYSIPVLDLFGASGMQPNIDAQNKAYFVDGLHPNDEGHRRIAEKLKNLMTANIHMMMLKPTRNSKPQNTMPNTSRLPNHTRFMRKS